MTTSRAQARAPKGKKAGGRQLTKGEKEAKPDKELRELYAWVNSVEYAYWRAKTKGRLEEIAQEPSFSSRMARLETYDKHAADRLRKAYHDAHDRITARALLVQDPCVEAGIDAYFAFRIEETADPDIGGTIGEREEACNTVGRILAAADKAVWQPMSTAPKDGRPIELFFDDPNLASGE